jgi:hypothetical protein
MLLIYNAGIALTDHDGKIILKNAVVLDVTTHGSYKNRRLGGTYGIHHQSDKNRTA